MQKSKSCTAGMIYLQSKYSLNRQKARLRWSDLILMTPISVLIQSSLLLMHAIDRNHFGVLEKVCLLVFLKIGQYPLTLWSVREEKSVCIDGVHESMLDGDIMDVSVSESIWILSDKTTLYMMDAKW